MTDLRKMHIAFNVAIRRASGSLPACDGPDCSICQCVESQLADIYQPADCCECGWGAVRRTTGVCDNCGTGGGAPSDGEPRMSKSVKTDSDLLHELERAVDRYPSDAQAAKAFGVSRGHLSRVLSGQKPITAKIALGLGYEQQHRYVRLEHRD